MLKTIALAVAAWIILNTTAAIAQQNQVIDRVVAVVGNEVVTQSELEIQLALMARRNPVNTQDAEIRKQVLKAMIDDKLVLAQADLDSIIVSDDRVDQQLESQIRYMEQQYGSRDRLEREAGMTIAQMKREYREDVRNRIKIQDLQALKFGDIKVTRREVTDFYLKYRDSLPQVPGQIELKQLVIYPRVLESFKEGTRKLAQSVLDSIRNGASFEEMAKRYSDDAGSARNGGNLGLARRGVFVKAFEEAAFNLEPGEVSDLVETEFGFHIIRLREKKGEAIEAQHILFKVKKTGESDNTAIDRLNALREEAMKGADFSTLVRQNSEDEKSKAAGGSLGIVEVEQLAKEVYSAQETLETGEITAPVKIEMKNDYAYAIFQVIRRIPPHSPDLQEDYNRIEAYARNMKQRELYDKWIDEIRSKIYWQIYVN